MRPRSCKVLAARVTSAVSNSSCLSGGSAAFIYATSAAIVNASTGVYVVRKRYAIEWRVKLSLGEGRDQIVGADRDKHGSNGKNGTCRGGQGQTPMK